MKTITKQKKTIEQTIYEMLKENTGIALCDSGGDGGRMWQRNQAKKLSDFKKEPSVKWEGDYYTISVYHHLVNGMELDDVCHEFNSQFVPAKNWDCGELEEVYGTSKEAIEWLRENGFKFKSTFNTYNEDSSLSQILQGTWLEKEDNPYSGDRGHYLLLQIHGGADARGGYTDARLFYVPEKENGALGEDVYGTVTKKDGTEINVDNLYYGTRLATEDGKEIEITEDDTVELEIMPR